MGREVYLMQAKANGHTSSSAGDVGWPRLSFPELFKRCIWPAVDLLLNCIWPYIRHRPASNCFCIHINLYGKRSILDANESKWTHTLIRKKCTLTKTFLSRAHREVNFACSWSPSELQLLTSMYTAMTCFKLLWHTYKIVWEEKLFWCKHKRVDTYPHPVGVAGDVVWPRLSFALSSTLDIPEGFQDTPRLAGTFFYQQVLCIPWSPDMSAVEKIWHF